MVLVLYITKNYHIFLKKKNSIKWKQKKIEEIGQSYLDFKFVKRVELNPLWNSPIYKSLHKEINEFTKVLETRLDFFKKKLMKNNLNISYSDLHFLRSGGVIFCLILSSIFFSSKSKNVTDRSVLYTSCYNWFVENHINFFKDDFYNIIVYNFILDKVSANSEIIDFNFDGFLKDYENSSVYTKSKFDRYFYKDLLLYFVFRYKNNYKESIQFNLNMSENNYSDIKLITKRVKIYRDILDEFNEYYRNFFNKEIYIFMSAICKEFFETLISLDYLSLKKTYDQDKKRIQEYLYVSENLNYKDVNDYYNLFTQLPMIVRPNSWTINGTRGGYLLNYSSKTYPLVRPLNKGNNTFHLTKSIVNTVNDLQNIPWTFNKEFSMYIRTDTFCIDNNIPLVSQLREYYNDYAFSYNKYKNYKESNSINLSSYYKSLDILYKSKDYRNKTLSERSELVKLLKYDFKISEEFESLRNILAEKESIYNTNLSIYVYHRFIVDISDIFIKSKIKYFYNPYFLDFRGRIYPYGWGFNQTSGIYKNMLVYRTFLKTKGFIYNSEALYNLKLSLSVYYNGKQTINFYKDWLYKNIDPLLSKDVLFYKDLRKSLYFYFKYGIIPPRLMDKDLLTFFYFINNSKDKILFLLSLYELSKYLSVKDKSKFRSFFRLSLDQSSSGPMIYSFLSKDFESSYLIGGVSDNSFSDKRPDIYNHFLLEFKNDLNLNKYKLISEENELKFSFFKENFDNLFDRSFSKLIIMPTFYNMQSKGIKIKLRGVINKFFSMRGDFLPDNIPLKSFSIYIYKLVRVLYPNLVVYQDNLVNFAKLLYNKGYPISIKTIDGGLISYSYIESPTIYRRVKRNSNYLTYRIYLPNEYSNQLSPAHYLAFPPNLIHSIDAGLCRLLLYFFRVNGIYPLIMDKLIPLHDSFNMSINSIPYFQSLYKYLFIIIFFRDLLDLKEEKKKLVIYTKKIKFTDSYSSPIVYINYHTYSEILENKNNYFYFHDMIINHFDKLSGGFTNKLDNISFDPDINKLFNFYGPYYLLNRLCFFTDSLDSDTVKSIHSILLKSKVHINNNYIDNYKKFIRIIDSNYAYFL